MNNKGGILVEYLNLIWVFIFVGFGILRLFLVIITAVLGL